MTGEDGNIIHITQGDIQATKQTTLDQGTRNPDIERVNAETRRIGSFLGFSPSETRYYELFVALNHVEDPGKRAIMSQELTTATGQLRREISPDNPLAPEVTDRFNGLQLAYGEMRQLVTMPEALAAEPAQLERMAREHGLGLVGRKTEVVRNFRLQATQKAASRPGRPGGK